MDSVYEKLLNLFAKENIAYEVIEHEHVHTSEEAAQICGVSIAAGAKSLLLKADSEFIIIVLPGNKKLDSKKAKQIVHSKSLCFATPEEVKAIMKCEVGSCYPFGSILGLKTYFDLALTEQEYIFFSPGVHTKSIKMKSKEYLKASNAEVVEVAQ